jgi:hypothetical protein
MQRTAALPLPLPLPLPLVAHFTDASSSRLMMRTDCHLPFADSVRARLHLYAPFTVYP